MKIGIIFTAFNSADLILKCLDPWIKVKNTLNHQFVYSCVSVPFEKFNIDKTDNTVELIKTTGIMDFLFADGQFKSEIAARGICLDYLKDNGCDFIWQVDADEFYTVEDITNIVNYIEKDKSTFWWKLCLKNYFQTDKQYLAEPFTPARIFRVNQPPYKLGDFIQDNDISFFYQRAEIPNSFVKSKVIPREVNWTKHLSWLNGSRSRDKIFYQNKRWGKSSYIYDEVTETVNFNPDYYPGGQFPEVIQEI